MAFPIGHPPAFGPFRAERRCQDPRIGSLDPGCGCVLCSPARRPLVARQAKPSIPGHRELFPSRRTPASTSGHSVGPRRARWLTPPPIPSGVFFAPADLIPYRGCSLDAIPLASPDGPRGRFAVSRNKESHAPTVPEHSDEEGSRVAGLAPRDGWRGGSRARHRASGREAGGSGDPGPHRPAGPTPEGPREGFPGEARHDGAPLEPVPRRTQLGGEHEPCGGRPQGHGPAFHLTTGLE